MTTLYTFQDLDTPSAPSGSEEVIFRPMGRPTPADGWAPMTARSLHHREPPPAPRDVQREVDEAPVAPEPRPTPVAFDREELDRLRAAARRQGLQQGREEAQKEGFEEGTRLARCEWDERFETLEGLIQCMEGAQESLFHAVKDDITRIITRIPEKILRSELSTHPEVIVGMTEAILRDLPRQRQIVLHAHPEDIVLINDATLKAPSGANLRLEADPTMARGGIILSTDAGDIDATIDAQLDRFLRQARAWLTGSETDEAAAGGAR